MTRVCVLNEFKAKLQTMDDAAVDDMIDECDVNNDFADEILTQLRQKTIALVHKCTSRNEAFVKKCIGRTRLLSDVIAANLCVFGPK